MLDTIASLNQFAEEAGITEVRIMRVLTAYYLTQASRHQPSLMNFCVTDGDSVVATRYVSSRYDEAASLVGSLYLLSYIV